MSTSSANAEREAATRARLRVARKPSSQAWRTAKRTLRSRSSASARRVWPRAVSRRSAAWRSAAGGSSWRTPTWAWVIGSLPKPPYSTGKLTAAKRTCGGGSLPAATARCSNASASSSSATPPASPASASRSASASPSGAPAADAIPHAKPNNVPAAGATLQPLGPRRLASGLGRRFTERRRRLCRVPIMPLPQRFALGLHWA